jgi:class 3 adenylate cyclase
VRLEIRYTRASGAAIAYQIVGEGSDDLVYVADYMSNLVYAWEWPRLREFYLRLASFSRLILFDKRGTGLSDHGGTFPSLETRMEDLRSVLDAVGSRRACVLAAYEGCSMAVLFAATYPERVKALILFQPVVAGSAIEDQDKALATLSELRERWGTQEYCDEILFNFSPTLAALEEERVWFANWLRVGASPAAAYALNRAYFETDLRDVLPAVRVPTLVLYRGSDMQSDATDVAARIPKSRIVRVPGDDGWGIFLSPEIETEVQRFLAGAPEPEPFDRVLTTLLFTDLLDSTARAATVGDAAWRELLRQHHDCVRQELTRHRGHEVDTAGDGFFATFDGPARAIRCADAIRQRLGDLGLPVRVGVHTGECELVDKKPAGVAVHTAARVTAVAASDEILVTSAVKDLVAGSGIAFADTGEHALRGIPDPVRIYRVTAL